MTRCLYLYGKCVIQWKCDLAPCTSMPGVVAFSGASYWAHLLGQIGSLLLGQIGADWVRLGLSCRGRLGQIGSLLLGQIGADWVSPARADWVSPAGVDWIESLLLGQIGSLLQ